MPDMVNSLVTAELGRSCKGARRQRLIRNQVRSVLTEEVKNALGILQLVSKEKGAFK